MKRLTDIVNEAFSKAEQPSRATLINHTGNRLGNYKMRHIVCICDETGSGWVGLPSETVEEAQSTANKSFHFSSPSEIDELIDSAIKNLANGRWQRVEDSGECRIPENAICINKPVALADYDGNCVFPHDQTGLFEFRLASCFLLAE